jgi:hypothetical protein
MPAEPWRGRAERGGSNLAVLGIAARWVNRDRNGESAGAGVDPELRVGIGAGCIVLAAHLPLLSTIPACVYGFACVAGLILLGKDMSPMNAIVPTIGSIIIGAGFGWLSETIGGKIAKS